MLLPTATAVLKELEDKDAPVLNLLALCRTQPYLGVWFEGPELLRRFARLLLKQGHPTLALEVAARGLDDKVYPNDHDLLYCRASPWPAAATPTRADRVRSGAARPYRPAPRDPQRRPEPRRAHPQRRRCPHSRPHRPHRPVPPGPRFLSAGIRRHERHLPRHQRCHSRPPERRPGTIRVSSPPRSATRSSSNSRSPAEDRDYWLLATLGEAYLLLGDGTAAKGRYARGRALCPGHTQRRRHRLHAPPTPPAPRPPARRRRPARPVPPRPGGRLRRPRPRLARRPGALSRRPRPGGRRPPRHQATNWTPWRPASAIAAPAAAARSSSAN